jgi:hypothetical protein
MDDVRFAFSDAEIPDDAPQSLFYVAVVVEIGHVAGLFGGFRGGGREVCVGRFNDFGRGYAGERTDRRCGSDGDLEHHAAGVIGAQRGVWEFRGRVICRARTEGGGFDFDARGGCRCGTLRLGERERCIDNSCGVDCRRIAIGQPGVTVTSAHLTNAEADFRWHTIHTVVVRRRKPRKVPALKNAKNQFDFDGGWSQN